MEKVVIWGASGHAKVVADILRLKKDYQVVGFLDDLHPGRSGTEFHGSRVLGGVEQLDTLKKQGITAVILGFGDCEARLRLADVVRSRGFHLVSAIHPGAIISRSVKIGAGTVVAAGAVINPEAQIGENVIVNTASSVDHDCFLGDGVHISPGVHLGGHVSVGRGTWIGLGAAVIDHISIGEGTIIGAGAVVIKDIPSNVVAFGNPARVIKQRYEKK